MIVAAPRVAPAEQRIRLSDVPWDVYVAFCDGVGERYLRMTYDQGELEIMSLSPTHEIKKSVLRRLVCSLTEELEIDIVSGGSMTCRNEQMQRALEPDECFWIAHEPDVRGREDIDLDLDPPPDLAFEIEISRSALNRMTIYETLRVPEVWRWDGQTLTVHWLSARGTYRTSKRSKAFPFLPLDEFASFLTRTDLGETKLIRAFRAWVAEHREDWQR
jgi:Uma2 family endonuclease